MAIFPAYFLKFSYSSCLFVDLQLEIMEDIENVKAPINKRQIQGTVHMVLYLNVA